MEQQYDFGMIGLGVMGSNLLLNMADQRFAAIGYDLKPERATAFEQAATPGTVVKGVVELAAMIRALKKPRKIMMLVPAGKPVDDVIASLLPLLEAGDIVIDGGNSFYKDTLRRVAYLQEKGFHFFGMGVSGGELGARTGPSMMPGGDKAAYEYLKPILEAIAAEADGVPCVAYMGKGAAGHYVKMVHNGIEYAMMQMISEVYDLLRRGLNYTNEQLVATFDEWNRGQLQSFLIEVTEDVFRTKDPETDQYLVDLILDQAGSKGTGKWTSQEAMNLPVSIPTIDTAVAMRDLSVYKSLRQQAAQLYKPQVVPVKAKQEELLAQLENALAFGFAVAYAQGLSMLAKASTVLEMDIPLPSVIQVWKAGCIIRSALLGNFTEAFAKDPGLSNILLDKGIAKLMQEREESMRSIVTLGVNSRIALPCLNSALTYYDAFLSERMPTNLIQAQRDHFGAHTYQRIDKEGAFHTEWHKDDESET
jgi:6-phosphogluconate dehydrogenase